MSTIGTTSHPAPDSSGPGSTWGSSTNWWSCTVFDRRSPFQMHAEIVFSGESGPTGSVHRMAAIECAFTGVRTKHTRPRPPGRSWDRRGIGATSPALNTSEQVMPISVRGQEPHDVAGSRRFDRTSRHVRHAPQSVGIDSPSHDREEVSARCHEPTRSVVTVAKALRSLASHHDVARAVTRSTRANRQASPRLPHGVARLPNMKR